METTEYRTPDELAILRAGQELDLMIRTSGYSPIECLRRVFLPVLEQVRADVKAACPSIPPTPEGSFHAARGESSLEMTISGDGSAEVEVYTREDKATTYLEADDLEKLRVWLKCNL